MTEPKKAEQEFKEMCNYYHIWSHKWADLRVCPRCKLNLFSSREDVTGESIVDYLVFIGSIPAWVECKGMPGHTMLPFAEINDKQRNFLDAWVGRGVWSFLFVTLGDGNAPKHRQAWLIPWQNYLVEEQKVVGRVSFPWKTSGEQAGFDKIFWEWQLTWQPNIGWTILPMSPLVFMLPALLNLPSLYGDHHE